MVIGVKSFFTGSSTIVMDYRLEGIPELLILHDVFIEFLFLLTMTVEFILESFDILGHETNVS